MIRPVRLGMLTPSSNTVLEPLTAAMLADLPGVSAHFSRFRVTEISLSESSQRQFDLAPILEAARLLADARVDVIAWNGTSAAWLGFDTDLRLCEAITEVTGTPATTSMLALNEALGCYGAGRFALVSPYPRCDPGANRRQLSVPWAHLRGRAPPGRSRQLLVRRGER
jgi:maleate isomerase